MFADQISNCTDGLNILTQNGTILTNTLFDLVVGSAGRFISFLITSVPKSTNKLVKEFSRYVMVGSIDGSRLFIWVISPISSIQF